MKNDSSIQIHYSDMCAFRKCRRSWDWTSPIRQNLRSPRTAPALWLGGGFHEAMDQYYGRGKDPVKFFKAWANKHHGELPDGDVFEEQTSLGLSMLEHYVEWAKVFDKADRLKVIDTEVPMSVDLTNDRFEYYGVKVPSVPKEIRYTYRVDGLCTIQGSSDVYIMEFKTMADLSDTSLSVAEQASLYLWAAKKCLGPKKSVKGVIYTLIRKKKTPDPDSIKSNTILDATYLKRFPQVKKSLGTERVKAINATESPFVWRRVVTRNSSEIQDIERRVYQIAGEMLNDPVLYPTPDLIGCRMCSMREPCVAMNRGDRYESLLKNLYVKGGSDRQYVPVLSE